MTEKEHQFWADRMAKEIIERVENDPILKKVVKENGYFVYDEKTPSGEIHIGSGRGWVIHDVLTKALKDKGVNARFVLSSDDFDPFDKPLKGKPEWDKYLGMPFRNMPSPVKGFESWADYYFKQATSKFEDYGIDAEFESTGEEYSKGTFNDAIRTVLNNVDKVKAIFERTYDKPYNKIPFNPICEKCGKIGTTLATGWDAKKELVSYTCKEDLVKWAKGCNHTGEVSPFNGGGKLPWKVEWAAKWPSKGVIVETAGKDHFTKGGSRTISIQISDEVLDYPPPYPSTRKETGPGYEFFNMGGKKMSTSKGMGVGFAALCKHVPAKILRYLMVSYKPYSVIDFDPSRKNDLLLIYDRYDTTERIYYGKEESDRPQEIKRMFELAHVGKIPKNFPPQISLRHAGVVVQIVGDDNEKGIKMLQETGHAPAKLSPEDNAYLLDRFNAARGWLREFAPENEKFSVQDTVSDEVKKQLTKEQKQALGKLKEVLEKKDYTNKELFEEFYTLSQEVGIKHSDFFKGVYLVLVGKQKGPRLASFILSIGKEKVIELLGQV